MIPRSVIPAIAFSLALAPLIFGQAKNADECPMMSTHQKGVNQRGDKVMGFSHEKTTHHFRLYADGGAVEVQANYAQDAASRDQIRMHLSHIAQMFAAGNFSAPMLIHDRVPPGVPVLKRLKSEISYQYSEIERGGVVRITTGNPEALKAVHQFLRFQISDHQTGDTGKVDARQN